MTTPSPKLGAHNLQPSIGSVVWLPYAFLLKIIWLQPRGYVSPINSMSMGCQSGAQLPPTPLPNNSPYQPLPTPSPVRPTSQPVCLHCTFNVKESSRLYNVWYTDPRTQRVVCDVRYPGLYFPAIPTSPNPLIAVRNVKVFALHMSVVPVNHKNIRYICDTQYSSIYVTGLERQYAK